MPPVRISSPSVLKPYWQTNDGKTVRLYQGDVLGVLRRLPAAFVHMVVTSPPYWGLRSYLKDDHDDKHLEIGSEQLPDCKQRQEVGSGLYRLGNCAERDWATGCHVCRMVLVMREVRRVLRDDGTLWLNYGDSYSSGTTAPSKGTKAGSVAGRWNRESEDIGARRVNSPDLPSGNLCGVPWRVALALRADGWVLRQDIIWHKPSPMPESVRNRCTKAHEYVFLLAKRQGYYYDAEAIKESGSTGVKEQEHSGADELDGGDEHHRTKAGLRRVVMTGRSNKRSVWGIDDGRAILDWLAANDPQRLAEYLGQSLLKGDTWSLSSQGYPGAHFATFPSKLIEPMVLAGTSARGCCGKCGAPWRRVVEERQLKRERPNEYVKRTGAEGTGNSCANTVAGVETKTVGWEPTCTCFGTFLKERGTRLGYGSYHSHSQDGIGYGLRQDGGPLSDPGEPTKEFAATVTRYVSDLPLDEHSVVPCVVLDPFCGSGTTNCVALEHGRHSVGIDLSEDYLLHNAVVRIEGALLRRPATARLVPRGVVKAFDGGGQRLM